MAKELKRKKRKLKRTVRKTLGTICLISAILIATIPVDGLKQVAADSAVNSKLTAAAMEKYFSIPDLANYTDNGGNIYSTGDGDFQFAYVDKDGTDNGNTRFAVILGYSHTGELPNGTLEIPNTVDAYLNYRTNEGSNTGYVAVGQSGNYLFYRTEEVVTPETTTSEGDVIPAVTEFVYHLCYYSDIESWQNLSDDELYYYPTPNFRPDGNKEPVPATDNAYARIKDAQVNYIGNQYLETNGSGGWQIAGTVTGDNPEDGIFSNRGSIVRLIVGGNMSGIGNYAFYGCTAMESITLSNALNTIGNYSFAGCLRMTTVNLNSASDITAIGAHAFENCQSLQRFTVPINVQAIGDAAFKECWSLSGIDLGGRESVALNTLGCDLFVNCRNLQSITFPRGFTEDVDISNFAGCISLMCITVCNTTMNITENFGKKEGKPAFGYEDFQKQYNDSSVVQGRFYFEGPTTSAIRSTLHQTAMDNYFAFSYLSDADLSVRNIYELTIVAQGEGVNAKKATYRVNNQNQLIEKSLDDGIDVIELPEYIGPYYIATINSKVFENDCYLKKLVIPSTVSRIENEAFRGCHHLENVVFENPMGLTIDTGAFRTQDVSIHIDSGCDRSNESETNPTLAFTGPISTTSGPFVYAMNPQNKINYGDQSLSYITYYSGWPNLLTVRYNPDTDSNELIDYPTLYDARHASETYAETSTVTDNGYVYPYMNDSYADALKNSVTKGPNDPTLTENERAAWDAIMNIVIPEGVESIKAGLFKDKELGTELEPKDIGDGYIRGGTYKTLKAYGLKEIAGDTAPEDDVDSGCFANCVTFQKIELYNGAESQMSSIGDYAFKGCTNLTSVTVPDTVTEIGKIPFTSCPKLDYVNFQGSEHFTCDNSVIYQLDTAGNKYKIIEYLEGRSSKTLSASETEGVTEIAPEAFAHTNVRLVDLSRSAVGEIPERAFVECNGLTDVILPASVRSVKDGAFHKCPNLERMVVPGIYTNFRTEAVDVEGPDRPNSLVFYCDPTSLAWEYAETWGFITDENDVTMSYQVVFKDWDGTVLKTEWVERGKDATPPETPVREGYIFIGWSGDYKGITGNVDLIAMYDAEDPDAKKLTVTFYDDDYSTVIVTRLVLPGQKVELPADPVKEGYVFIGWKGNGGVTVDDPITQNTDFVATYSERDGRYVVRFIDYDGTVLSTQLVNPGEAPIDIKEPTREGYTFTGWLPSDYSVINKDTDIYATYQQNSGSGNTPGGNEPGGNTPGGNTPGGGDTSGGDLRPGGSSKLYTLTVQNGSGSGSYVAGSQPIVIANNPASGQEFSHWTIDPSDTKISSTVLSATVITKPVGNATVTAHYKTKSGSSTVSGNASINGSTRPGTSGSVSNGTSVVIDKNGLSNTGVVNATVKGSTDNFVIKVTESSAASEAALKALQAEYGDISNIKYFPMDISLYDSTGTKKITDTTGLTVTITLPLPDSLITYAGNNKVAGVVNNKLDKLTPKFTTIDKVACITFTAEHFSPYVIYVETDNLTAGIEADKTPKTGDGIHPKWFLSIGLACVAVVLFLKKDKRALQRTSVA